MSKIFKPHFKTFYKFFSTNGTKISIFEKNCFTQFSLTKLVSQRFTSTRDRKLTKKFQTTFFKTFYKFFPPIGPKFRYSKKNCFTQLFFHKTCFTTFHIHWRQKIDKKFSKHIFQNILQVFPPNWTKISIFEKKLFHTNFHSQNMFHNVSHPLQTDN